MKQFNFSPWWLTGFTQADGTFIIIVVKQPRGKFLYRFRPVFELSQSVTELNIMTALQKHLGGGRIVINRDRLSVVFSSMEELLTIILPHFDKYTLRGGKFISYLIFRQVVLCIKNKEHLHLQGFLAILDLCYMMHTTSVRDMSSKQEILNNILFKLDINSFEPITPIAVDFLSVKISREISPDFVSGLIDGDGSIGFGFSGNKVRATISITMGIDDYTVLLDVQDFFKCGNVSKIASKEAARYRLASVSDMIHKVQPVLSSCHMNTVKGDYLVPCFKV